MSAILATLVTVVAAVLAFLAMIAWLRSRASDLAAASKIMDDFYVHAQRVVSDEETPETIVRVVEALAARAGRPQLARGLALHFLSGRPRKPNVKSTLQRDLQGLRPEMADEFAKTVAGAFITSAASDPIFSGLFARIAAAVITRNGTRSDEPSVERAATVAIEFDSHMHGYGHATAH